ncbi:uncharacterized mitochondrial protein AtMg01250-like [Phaseolus vulgaris]|uniref:uncharacterized mitochondrial protein AtMg01250-like n=1 Tax=Phaseolus vulgaris TaxID=3885 RepID=UPI0035CB5C2E
MSSVSVLVNDNPTTEFIPEKGLRQGDPLTTFIFLIVAEGLTDVVTQEKEKGMLDSIEIGERKTNVSMLQFTDDTLFFNKANLQSVLAVKATLMCFELASGLKANYSKRTGKNDENILVGLRLEKAKSSLGVLG